MFIFWHGWGIGVFFLFCFWMIAALVFGVAIDFREPDPLEAALEVQWGVVGMMLAYALSVYALARYRKNHPLKFEDPETGHISTVQNVDDLYGIRLDHWPGILAAIAAFLALLTASGHIIFDV